MSILRIDLIGVKFIIFPFHDSLLIVTSPENCKYFMDCFDKFNGGKVWWSMLMPSCWRSSIIENTCLSAWRYSWTLLTSLQFTCFFNRVYAVKFVCGFCMRPIRLSVNGPDSCIILFTPTFFCFCSSHVCIILQINILRLWTNNNVAFHAVTGSSFTYFNVR